ATTCVPGNEIYSYWVPEDKCEIVFNDLYGLVGKMTDDDYVPYSANDVDQFPQHKVKNWKNSAYKKFDERESSGHLTPDYFMINGRPVRAVPHDVGPSVQGTTT
uniref:Calmodulin binding protein C-terminal domain-containing protein n=1 Tax=Aegilops tauschii subsp. strangulata TaxID=200361 RepID=A0A453LX25_AEGTS